jgi:hypothetical protein
LRCRAQQLKAKRQGRGTPAVGQEAEVPNADEAFSAASFRSLASPGAWASTRRAACDSQDAVPRLRLPANPDLTRSSSQRCNSSAPSLTRSSLRAAVFACDSGSLGSFDFVVAAVSFLAARSLRPFSQEATVSGAEVLAKSDGCSAKSKKRASPCLQGNLRLGQLHLKAGSARSI